MNWILDIILVAFILLVIFVNTKRGCKTILNLLTTVVTFASAYLFGPKVGRLFLGEPLQSHVTGVVKGLLKKLMGEGDGALSISDLFEKLPEGFVDLLDRTGANIDALKAVFGKMTVATEADLENFANEIALPVAETLASAIGCVLVFVAAYIAMIIVKIIVGGLVKLPVLKQANGILGFVLGVISAFAYTWIICLALSVVVEYGLIEQYNALLSSLAENSYIFRFFCNFSLMDFVNII